MFKSFDELLLPDVRMGAFARLSPETGPTPVQLRQYHDAMAALTLPTSVPEAVRDYFDATRMLWVYGYCYYPFFTWADLHAGLCAEMALRLRLESTGEIRPGDERVSFRSLLERARARGFLRGEGFAHLQRIHATRDARQASMREAYANSGLPEPQFAEAPAPESFLKVLEETFPLLRNAQAHPRQMMIFLPSYAALTIELLRDLIVQLFESPAASTATPAASS
jgi:hypothetical protein